MNVSTSSTNLHELDPSFMYSQLLMECLLEITETGSDSMMEFILYLRQKTDHHLGIDKLEREYQHHTPIWWYTSSNCFYSILNSALRTLEVGAIIKMRIFICDLYRNIQKLYSEQSSTYDKKYFTVYRGQALSNAEFLKMKHRKGGLLSFNSFWSTSKSKEVSLAFAKSNENNSYTTLVLFEIYIDSSVSSSPFVDIHDHSSFSDEEEILFSMQAIFRIGDITLIDSERNLWQVSITLSSDSDIELKNLIAHMRKEMKGSSGWDSLGQLLFTLGEFKKAEEVYQALLYQKSYSNQKGYLYHQLGYAKYQKSENEAAILLYKKAIALNKPYLSRNHPHLATSYSQIGAVYDNIGKYSEALKWYKKALKIRQATNNPTNWLLAVSYNNIGLAYKKKRKYLKSLSFYQRALDIFEKSLPSNHPSLAISYSNMGIIHDKMKQYSQALSCYNKAFCILERVLPSKHPDLATVYNNKAKTYYNMKDYSKARTFCEFALNIAESSLPSAHSDFDNYSKGYELICRKQRLSSDY